MAVRVPCPNCQTLCQVEDKQSGKAVQCGKCGQPFLVGSPSPAGPAPEAPARAGLWQGLRGLVQAVAPRRPDAAKADDALEDLPLVLDAPGAPPPGPAPAPVPARGWAVPPLPGVCRLDIGAATSPGRARARNEDGLLVQHLAWSNLDRRQEAAVVAVADGMGGHEAGDKASALVIRTLGGSLGALLSEVLTGQIKPGAVPARLNLALKAASKAVLARAKADAACNGMGATAAVVFVLDGVAHLAHVGDCRVYHYAAERLVQVSKDQTLVARMVELGQLRPEEARTHPKRNEVIQAIGWHADPEPAAGQLTLTPGDWLLVACDGLEAHVDPGQMAQALAEAPGAGALAQRLVDLADEGGGSDNCTVVAVRCY